MEIAEEYIKSLASSPLKRSVPGVQFDLDWEITSEYTDPIGITHVYFRQLLNKLPVDGATLQIHIKSGKENT